MKVASTKLLVDVKTSLKLNVNFKIRKPQHYFIEIMQCNVTK